MAVKKKVATKKKVAPKRKAATKKKVAPKRKAATKKAAETKKKAVTRKAAKAKKPAVGDIGYKFRKKFDDGWYSGEVTELRPGAAKGKDRRCLYEDGDSEDLSLAVLRRLALLEIEHLGSETENK